LSTAGETRLEGIHPTRPDNHRRGDSRDRSDRSSAAVAKKSRSRSRSREKDRDRRSERKEKHRHGSSERNHSLSKSSGTDTHSSRRTRSRSRSRSRDRSGSASSSGDSPEEGTIDDDSRKDKKKRDKSDRKKKRDKRPRDDERREKKRHKKKSKDSKRDGEEKKDHESRMHARDQAAAAGEMADMFGSDGEKMKFTGRGVILVCKNAQGMVEKSNVRSSKTGGDPPLKGQTVTVHLTGYLSVGMKQFWSTRRSPTNKYADPFSFIVGTGKVIKGLEEGVLTMRQGEQARLTISSAYAYGFDGFPLWGIPPHADLVFDVELIKIHR